MMDGHIQRSSTTPTSTRGNGLPHSSPVRRHPAMLCMSIIFPGRATCMIFFLDNQDQSVAL